MQLKFKQLNKEAILPKYAKPGDAGMDLTSVAYYINDSYIEYDTGLAVEIPDGYAGLLFPRSSVTTMGLILKNSIGLIDSKYRGPIKCRFHQIPESNDGYYDVGERVAQLVIVPVATVEPVWSELTETDRGAGGFGSTNK